MRLTQDYSWWNSYLAEHHVFTVLNRRQRCLLQRWRVGMLYRLKQEMVLETVNRFLPHIKHKYYFSTHLTWPCTFIHNLFEPWTGSFTKVNFGVSNASVSADIQSTKMHLKIFTAQWNFEVSVRHDNDHNHFNSSAWGLRHINVVVLFQFLLKEMTTMNISVS